MNKVKVVPQGNFFWKQTNKQKEHGDPDWASKHTGAGSPLPFYSNTDGDCVFSPGSGLSVLEIG